MKIYYAHAICLYGTEIEQEEIKLIKSHFPNCQITDPGSYEGNLEKKLEGMTYCYDLIKLCDGLVFSKLIGKVTSGVGLEITFSLTQKISVYLLENTKFTGVKKPVRYLSRGDTIRHYDLWRSVTGRDR